LRNDQRVILRERTNLRHLQPADLYGNKKPKTSDQGEEIGEINEEVYADLGVVDVSFISLTKILNALWQLLQAPREMVLLVKPQFEVGRSRVGKKGVVRDPNDHADAIFQVLQTAQNLGWLYKGLTWSPLMGPAGNIEYLLWLGMDSLVTPPDLATIKQLTQSAVAHFRNTLET
jgi:23S rRNA (cytidine1920-2'-O)/16S rRNA (cytidine1409-2'-O)-methyltransferase